MAAEIALVVTPNEHKKVIDFLKKAFDAITNEANDDGKNPHRHNG